ncbi:uncharacterized protein LOC123524190 isoform X2 [Mercenaria mercenaria]|nr:uncharacterized protein LOC123524190 isoform X2 [Mercenaria mercenaria]
MTMVYLFILQLCAIPVSVFCGRLEQLEERVQAVQTLAFQDIHRLKESVDRNALKIDTLTDLINRTLSYITNTVESTTEFRHGHDKKPIERNENNEYKTLPANPDVKRLKRAFQEHKMYSVSLQENMMTQLEKTVHEKDALIKNMSGSLIDLKSEIKSDLDEMRSDIALMLSDVHLNTIQTLTGLLRVESKSILMQTDEILNEANRSRYMLSDSISAVNVNTLQMLKRCSNISDQLVANRFEIEAHQSEHMSTLKDHISELCGANPEIRLGDSRVVKNGRAGRVEVRYNDQWGTVCNDGFGAIDAKVACKMAGFTGGVVTNGFSGGYGKIWLDDLECTGSETNLFDCPRANNIDIGEHNCGHGEDVGVTCF